MKHLGTSLNVSVSILCYLGETRRDVPECFKWNNHKNSLK